jgi:hypothetical protein
LLFVGDDGCGGLVWFDEYEFGEKRLSCWATAIKDADVVSIEDVYG